MGTQRVGVDLVREEPPRRPANQEPMLPHRGFLTRHEYARRIRTCALIAAALGLVAAAAACDSSSGEKTAGGGSTTTVTVTTTPPDGGGIDTLPGAGTTPVSGEATTGETALLERVAVGRHEGYDRVVFQFRGAELPGYRVAYVQPPLREDGSGNVVAIKGGAFVLVRMEPASGFDLNTGEGELVYKGPRRLPGASVVREVVRTGDFEAVLSWAVGLDEKVDFRVLTLSSPSRLVVDFRNH
jgi:hypothetical protein